MILPVHSMAQSAFDSIMLAVLGNIELLTIYVMAGLLALEFYDPCMSTLINLFKFLI